MADRTGRHRDLIRISVFAVIYFFVSTDATMAQSRAAFVCTFTERHFAEMDPTYKPLKASRDTIAFTVAAIDPESRSAQMIGNAGAANVTADVVAGHWRFIEVTPTGDVTVTSVFGPLGNSMPALHSRHIWIGVPLVSQFTGSCSARN